MSQHDDQLVERVARAILPVIMAQVTGRAPRETYDTTIEENREAAREVSRAALTAHPERELRIGDFILRHRPNGIWIGRRGGEGGEFATEHVERVIAQFYRENF